MRKQSEKPRLAILISGRGSNMQALVNACQRGEIDARVCLVVSNNPDAAGLQFAIDNNIPVAALDHRCFKSRTAFEHDLQELIADSAADCVLLAGFMRVLSEEFVAAHAGRMLNIHPSLLPRYPGLDTHARALASGDSLAGASVHFVTQLLDGGPVILQAQVAIEPGDTASKLAERVLKIEHEIYPLAVNWLLEGKIALQENKCLWNGQPLRKPHLWNEI